MKILLVFTLILAPALNCFAAPMVFKSKKEITDNKVTEIAAFDTSKYKQIRISIRSANRTRLLPKPVALDNLNNYKGLVESTQKLLAQGVVLQSRVDLIKKELEEAQKAYDMSVENAESAGVFGVEESGEDLLMGFSELMLNKSFIIECPPTKISIKVYGQGSYSVYIYAVQ